MPSPVLALPWGSRSTISTRSPIAASAVARLIAVVVLPTPPFWFAMVMIRFFSPAMDIRQSPAFSRKLRKFEHHGIRLDNTGMFYQIESPPSMRFLDLPLIIPAFMEEKLEIRIALGPGQA